MLALVNKERAAAGCGPVTANAKLTKAADDYSDVMAASGVMSHTGPDGSTMTSRVEAAGYAWSTLGENIARGQADAEAVMDAWMNSPGHRANILNCSFDELGVGVHMGDGGPGGPRTSAPGADLPGPEGGVRPRPDTSYPTDGTP
ncbi:CAP domain-containing protein [Streptomyces zhihengii]